MTDPYTYPPYHTTLRNKFELDDPDTLDQVERRMVGIRSREPLPSGDFDLKHLQAIHRHLFQDMYAWAGEIRTVRIGKGGNWFVHPEKISDAMAWVHTELSERDYLKGLSGVEFAKGAAETIGHVNYVHPFREGNGRTQLMYLSQLAERAGHPVNLAELKPSDWVYASVQSFATNYDPMARAIQSIIIGDQLPERNRQADEKDISVSDNSNKKIGPSAGDVLRHGVEDIRRTWEQVTYGREPTSTPAATGGSQSDLTGKGADIFREFFGETRDNDTRTESRANEQERENDQDIDR